MKHANATIAAAGITALLSGAAMAGISDLKEMKSGSSINLTGTVESVENEREFTLRDSTGTIDVDIASNQSVTLKEGDSVNVSGTLDKALIGTNIDATTVTVNKSASAAMSEAIEGHTGISLEGATTYDIASLPKEGLVKVSGTVTDVDNEKEFTVKDETGSVKIDVKSAESVAVTEDAEVTVVGYMDSGMLGKNIDAQKVIVLANAPLPEESIQ